MMPNFRVWWGLRQDRRAERLDRSHATYQRYKEGEEPTKPLSLAQERNFYLRSIRIAVWIMCWLFILDFVADFMNLSLLPQAF
ncbi:MAG: hypothetical protein F4Y05_02210 [Acidimicrobiaceae bacterium]|nr:hypothetical protein [Acidimicrobiaceae bacterium]MYE08399.1 hypothetical protein [Acidimicrobiaceae bacterium]MYI37173.1 hypothetical protein [Acidimicrobiaceae bacterium]